MEVGQPAAPAPSTAIRAAQAALAHGRIGYTETLGIPSLRARIARHYSDVYDLALDPARVVVTTGSSGAFILAFLALFEPGDRVTLLLEFDAARRELTFEYLLAGESCSSGRASFQ